MTSSDSPNDADGNPRKYRKKKTQQTTYSNSPIYADSNQIKYGRRGADDVQHDPQVAGTARQWGDLVVRWENGASVTELLQGIFWELA